MQVDDERSTPLAKLQSSDEFFDAVYTLLRGREAAAVLDDTAMLAWRVLQMLPPQTSLLTTVTTLSVSVMPPAAPAAAEAATKARKAVVKKIEPVIMPVNVTELLSDASCACLLYKLLVRYWLGYTMLVARAMWTSAFHASSFCCTV
jgi:hypothetical protein